MRYLLLLLVAVTGYACSTPRTASANDEPIEYADRIVADFVRLEPLQEPASFLLIYTPNNQLYGDHLAFAMAQRGLTVISDLNNAQGTSLVRLGVDSLLLTPAARVPRLEEDFPDSDYAVILSAIPYNYAQFSRDNLEKMVIRIIERPSNRQVAAYNYDRTQNDWSNYRYIIDNFLDRLMENSPVN